jgi:hypothetical protein
MADEQTTVPPVDVEKMRVLGIAKAKQFEQYKKDRRETEQQWLRNLRQFRGIYDPEIERRIPADQSKAYPKITRTKVIGTVSRLMEMLFPQTEKNWGIEESPLPDLSESDLQLVLDQLTAERAAATPEGQTPDNNIPDDEIEKAIKSFAHEKALRMSHEMEDQLDEIEYITLARRVIFSAVLYSAGILRGPQVVSKKARQWTRDAMGKLKAVVIEKFAPMYEFTSVWDWYPDLSAKVFAQMDGSFFRHVMSRNQVSELAKRPDFMADVVTKYLRDNTAGNYKELEWEIELRTKGDRSNLTNLTGRKFEAWEWWGFVSGHDLRAAGVNIPDGDLGKELEANLWGIDNTIIKAKLNPYDAKIRPHHVFVYEEDDINLLGIGVPQVMRDSALAIGEASRMMLDNASVVCGPMLELNQDLLVPGQSLDVYARKIWLREGQGQESAQPAVRSIQVDAHIPELKAIIDLFMSFADTETALPPSALGDVTKGGSEALRTQGNLSMLMGAASLPIRDTVRNFDHFTTSFVSSLYYWNMEFNDDESMKGDFAVIARGSTSLIAKEVRSVHLDQFATTLTPEERMHISTRKMLEERMRSRDLPMDILEDADEVARRLKEQADSAAMNAQQQADLIRSEIRKNISNAFKDFALAIKAQTGANIDTFTALVEGIVNGNDQGGGAGASKGSASGSR